MAEINEILAKEAIDGIKLADRYISDFDDSIQKLIRDINVLNESLGKEGKTLKDIEQVTKKTANNKKTLDDATRQAAQAEKELARRVKETERDVKKLADTRAKAAAKEREHIEALNLEVKTVGEAKRQLKALTIEHDNATTAMGKQSQAVKDLNARMQQNTEFIRSNGTAAEKQRMNIGNYASAFKGLGSAMMGALGITAGLTGVIKGFQFVINSTDATADAFQRTMSGLREQANYFGRAIANMNFSNFIEGMREARREGERYFDALDLIEDKQRALGLQKEDIDLQILEQKIIAKNKRNEISVRQAAVEEIIRLEELKRKKSKALADETLNNELKNAASISKVHQQYKGEIVDFVKNYESNIDKIKRGEQLIAQIRAKNTQVISVDQYGNQTTRVNRNQELIDRSRLNAQDRETIRFAEYNIQLTKEKRDLIAAASSEQTKAMIEEKEGLLSLSKLRNSLYNELIKEEDDKADAINSSVERQKTAFEQLTEKIADLKIQIENTILITGKAPQGLVRELIGSQEQLNDIKVQMDAILESYTKMTGKGLSEIAGSTTGGLLTPRATPAPFGASDPGGKDRLFAKDDYLEMTQTAADAALTIITNADQAAYDNKMNLLEKEKEAKLKNAKLTEKQREKIEADYSKKVSKLKEEQFKKQKAADIIQAIINTALAVSRVAGNIPQMVLAGLVGAAQVAIIAAQPVPQFDKGTKRTPSVFVAGERRPEWMITPSGDVQLVAEPTMFKNMAGATVIGGEETERMLKSSIVPNQDIRPDLNRMRNEIVNAIRTKRELYISANGTAITEREGEYFKTYFNKSVQWAGRKP